VNPVQDLATIYWDAVREVDPAELILSRVKKDGRTMVIRGCDSEISEDLSRYKEIMILGVGKASARMAQAMENRLGDDLSCGFIVTKYGHGLTLRKIRVMEAGHPIPDENSLEGARILVRKAGSADEHTLIINLISGGGSALLCLPADGISLEEKREATRVLLESGATIDEVNCVRKHISKVKGGGLAVIARPARLINLILSDVIGDRIDTIASGITAPDPTTFSDALSILRKYSLQDKLPRAVREHLSLGAQGAIAETPKADNPAFVNTVNIILGSNKIACAAACRSARALGYNARLLSTTLTGEAAEAGVCFARLAREVDSGRCDPAKPAAVIAGGETTVTIRGKGKGGRNQELALAFAIELHRICPGSSNFFFLSGGTDGTDGPTDAAGAFVTPELLEKMREISESASIHLRENDSYNFFRELHHLFKTGPTYTNVCDIQILIVV
jgi:glycerate 2-kinase